MSLLAPRYGQWMPMPRTLAWWSTSWWAGRAWRWTPILARWGTHLAKIIAFLYNRFFIKKNYKKKIYLFYMYNRFFIKKKIYLFCMYNRFFFNYIYIIAVEFLMIKNVRCKLIFTLITFFFNYRYIMLYNPEWFDSFLLLIAWKAYLLI